MFLTWSFAVILRIDITVSLRPSESLYYVGLSPVFMWLLFLYCWEYATAGFGFKLPQWISQCFFYLAIGFCGQIAWLNHCSEGIIVCHVIIIFMLFDIGVAGFFQTGFFSADC